MVLMILFGMGHIETFFMVLFFHTFKPRFAMVDMYNLYRETLLFKRVLYSTCNICIRPSVKGEA